MTIEEEDEAEERYQRLEDEVAMEHAHVWPEDWEG